MSNMLFNKIICFDKHCSNEGCDLVCIDNNDNFWLIEIKSCKISYSDADDAIEQLNYTEQWVKQNWNKIHDRKHRQIVKVFLHDKRKKGCKLIKQASNLFKKHKEIKRPNINNGIWRFIVAYYYENCT